MTTIGYATLQLIPSLRGVREAIARGTRNLTITADIDVSGAREAGLRAGRDIRRGIAESRIAAGLHQHVERELSSANASRIGNRFGSSLGASILSSIRSISAGFDTVTSSGASVLRNVGAIATGTKIASRAAQHLSRWLVAAGGAVALLGGGGVGRLALGLQLVSRAAGNAARDIGRVTASLVVLTAIGRGLATLNRLGRIAAIGTIGFSALLGVATGVSTLLGGPMVAALTAVGAAMGVAAGAAAGILGPALLTLAVGFKGLQDAAKAYTTSDGGASQAKSVAAAVKQVEQAEKNVERAKRDSRDAERDLTRARKDAAEQIEDMNLALRGSALSEKDAQLSLLEARRDLQNLGKDGQPVDMLDRERAVLRVQEAEQRLAETQESNGDLAQQAAEANRLGVEGSDQVVAAKQRVVDANQAVVDAEQQVADARQAVADAQSQGQSGIDPFDAMIGQRMAPILDAAKNVRQAVTDNLSAALVPAFTSLGGLLDGLRPKLGGLATTLGGVGTAVATAISGPDAAAGFNAMIAASNTFVGSLQTGLAGLSTGVLDFVSTAAQTFAGAGTSINGVLAGIGDWLRNITPEQMTAAFDQLQQVVENIGNVVGPVLSALRELGGISAPALAPGFQAIGAAITQATPGVMTMARELMPALGQAMQNIAPVLPSIVNAFTPWASVVAVLAPHIATLVAHLGPLAPLVLGVALAAKTITTAMVGYNAVMAIASVGQGVFAAATGAGTASLGTNAIALAAHRVAMIAGATATKAITAAQWLWNAAMTANPIGLVIAAIAAFVAGIIYAYKNSETFRKIVDAAWNAIKVAAKAVVDWFVETAWPFLKQVWEAIGAGWSWLATKAGEVWTDIKTRFTTMVDWFKNLPTAISNAVKGMWEGLKIGLVAVLNWIGDKWNAFADALSFHIPNPFGDDIDVNIPKLPKFVATEGFSAGGYTGKLPTKQIAGVVHGDEHVIKATSRQMIESSYPGLLDYMNATGRLPGYEVGGKVGAPVQKKGTAEGLNPGADYLRTLIMKTWPEITRIGGRRAEDGFREHSTGNAIDIMIPNYAAPEGKALGDTVLAFLQKNGSALQVDGIIWRQTSYGYGGALTAGKGMDPRGNDTQNHMDHLHVILGKGRGADAAPIGLPTSELSGVDNAGSTPSTDSGSGVDMSKLGLDAKGGALQDITDSNTLMAESGTGSSSSSSASASYPTSVSGWAGFAAEQLVGGQVKSALSVFGIPDSPGWLQGVSSLIGGISVSEKSTTDVGGGTVTHAGTGAAPGPLDEQNKPRLYDSGGWLPQGVHQVENRSGSPEPILTQDYWRIAQDGINVAMTMAKGFGRGDTQQQAPPPVVYNIQARDTEDAFIRAQRQERERAAAKLSRF